MAMHFDIRSLRIRTVALTLAFTAGLGNTAAAERPPVGSFAVVATSLRGSKASIEKMYTFARRHDIEFLRTSADVDSAVAHGHLMPLAGSPFYEVSAAVGFPYASPEARAFVEGLAPHFVKSCGAPMVITSATRPETRQPRNAAQLSVHPTGIAVDLRKPYPGACLTWLRDTLLTMENDGKIEVTEERHPPHFHIAVLSRPGSAPIPGLIDLLAAADSAISGQPDGLTELAQTATPTLAFEPLFRAPLPLSGLLAAMTGEELVLELDVPITTESAGEVALAPVDSATAMPDANASTATSDEAKPAAKARARTHTVRSGDTLWDIAKKYDLSVGELQRANKLGKRSKIRPKMTLKIPG